MKGWGRRIRITVPEDALTLTLTNAKSGVEALRWAYDKIELDETAEKERDAEALRLVCQAVRASKIRRAKKGPA